MSAAVRPRPHALTVPVLGVVTALALLLSLLVVPSASAAPSPIAEPVAAPTGQVSDPPAMPGAEVVGLRERFSETFATEKASEYETVTSPSPVHFKDGGGGWQKIERGLRPQAGRRFGNEGRNDFGLSVAGDHTDRQLARIESKAGQAVGFGLEGARPGAASPDPASDGQDIVYRSILPHVDLRLSSLADGLKEVLILRSAKAPTRYVFPMRLEGLTAELQDRAVLFRDEAGTEVFRTTPPTMMDSSGGPHAPGTGSLALDYRLIEQPDGAQALELTLSPEWLADPARVFPVQVDPTVNRSTYPHVFADTTYAQSDKTQAFGWIEQLGTGHTTKDSYRAFVQFGDGSKLTPGDGYHLVISPTASLYQKYALNCGPHPIYLKRVTQGWWQNPNGLAGQFGPSYDPAGVQSPTGVCPSGTVNFDVTSWARGWQNGSLPNFGVAVLGSLSFTDSYRYFATTEVADAAQRPKLHVRWQNNVPTATENRLPANGAVLTTPPQNLSVKYGDEDSDWGRLRYQLERRQSNGSWAMVRDYETGALEPRSVEQLPVGQTLSAGVYRWRTQAWDGSDRSSWAPDFTFTVETPPLPPSIGSGGVGHVFNGVNQGGTIRFLDGQTGGPASFSGFDAFTFLRTN